MLEELLHPKSLVQIVVLALAYFLLLTGIRGTRGAWILKGVVFLVVITFLGVMWVATALELEQIKLLLQNALAGSFIALIIIFAPELRRGLLRIAQAPFLAPLLHGPSLHVIDEVVNASVRLSKNRIGALIAIEREVGLGEYVENGQKIDALVSAELLETIFYPGNPLHDGAVIVQHERVAASACLFPLSEDPSLSRTMGTRHRAAIGITEETDAIAIAVSEETGRISVCARGKMSSDLSRESLERVLRELYTRNERATMALRVSPDKGREEPPDAAAAAAPPSPPSAPAAGQQPAPADSRKRRKGEAAAPEGDAASDTRKARRGEAQDKEKKTA